ncbi:23S rRNA (adenine2030-N6)-methyltransferase [Arboricoccus pini]|uniref:Ribosomal RNA large subunit methyltransferase J n=1 Tax=Arboricoccus pini TaxID=1963835 RepID=A0A212QQP8_9PROT|nr:23S rRNA (adenine(2030)-N(6))-methyltransferase RlmJ [Arboricoccus pini]SNB61653.1 23S rRNA (adenine2030-N6)-methyltransferase [Arboricoccus pini]
MLSYRHAFHAGNQADMLKHALFCFTLAYALQKPRPLFVLDTHAGAGSYDLETAMALKTGEAMAGIGRLLPLAGEAPSLFQDYLRLVRAANGKGPLRRYPGSPALAAAMLRHGDRLCLIELHPTDHQTLIATFASQRRVRVTREDGLKGLLARLPPAERRAVVLIDPSYEIKKDYEDVVAGLTAAYRRFPTGTYILWYPVVDRARIDAMMTDIAGSGMRRLFRLEWGEQPDSLGHGMTASGMVVVNPPYTLPEAAESGLEWLATHLGAGGPRLAEWLVGE